MGLTKGITTVQMLPPLVNVVIVFLVQQQEDVAMCQYEGG